MNSKIKATLILISLSLASQSHAAKLLLSEIVVNPTGGEFIEIYNPGPAAISLDNYFLSDVTDYYLITEGTAVVSGSDFIAQFPAGSSIAAKDVVVVSLETTTAFQSEYGTAPDFDSSDMLGTISVASGLSNSDEVLTLFFWDGVTELVSDVDYLLYGDASHGVDKTGLAGYQNDTPAAGQDFALAPINSGESLQRIDFFEAGQTPFGGNGITGADETSEQLSATWIISGSPTPGASAVPIPPAIWLFGSALGLLGCRKRRAA